MTNNTATLTLTNFTITFGADTSTVTFEYTGGTVTVDGTTVASGDTVEIASTGAAVVATPASGYTFLGWVDASSGLRKSTKEEYTLAPTGDMTIQAAFAKDTATAWFYVPAGTDMYMYNNLNAAATKAAACDKQVILAASGTLSSSANETDGVYTIPSGVTLLIPYNSDHTVVTTEPPVSSTGGYTTPTAYRTLTMASGANIVLKGKLSVAASLIASQTYGYNGLPNGATGQIKMDSGSSISVESGGIMYAIGFIYGSGDVEVKSNGTVYECFQLRDFRGGDATSTIIGDRTDKRLFPMMQYYVQNIQVPMKLHAGAIEKGVSSFNITLLGTKYSEIPFIGSGSMFNIASGYVTKDYDETTDRLIITVNGSLQVNNYEFNIVLGIGQSVTLKSVDYFLPINHNISIDIQTGSVAINQDIALLPGAEIKVQDTATCTLGSGTEIVVYDAAEWGYYIGEKYTDGETNTWLKPLKYIAGGTIVDRRSVGLSGLADASIMINGTVDASAGQIYSTSSGANIYSTGNGELKLGAAGTLDTVYQATQNSTSISYNEITITPAILQNANDSVVATGDENHGVGTYNYINKFWHLGTCSGGTATCLTKATCTVCGVQYGELGGHTKESHTAQAPTYDTAGNTAYWYCSVCKNYYSDEACTTVIGENSWLITAAKIGDTEYKILSEAIAAADSSVTIVLQADIDGEIPIGKLLTIDKNGCTANLKAENGFVITETGDDTVTAQIKIMATSVKAGDGLDLYFYILKSAWDSAFPNTQGQAVITREYADGKAPHVPESVAWLTDVDGYYRFCYSDIAAKEMTDPVSIVIKVDGVAVSNTHTETIRDYALRTFGTDTSELDTALMDMLNYGAAAQEYFGYNAENPANAEDDEGVIGKYAGCATPNGTVAPVNNLVKGENLVAVSVSAKSKLMLTFYFTNITRDMTATVTYQDHSGNSVAYEVQGSDFIEYNGWYGVDVIGLAIADGRQVVSCEVKNGEAVVASASDSVEGYIARNYQDGKVVVLDMLMRFVDSAYAYFH